LSAWLKSGTSLTDVRGKEKVLGEVGLAFIGYNLTRCISMLGVEKLIRKLSESCLPLFLSVNRRILRLFEELILATNKFAFSLE